jgi:hypothetical protein
MSLRTFIEKKEVSALLSSYVKVAPTPGFVPPSLLAPAQSMEYRLVGAAFDYLMRTLVERMNPGCQRTAWIASAALLFFREDLEEIDSKLFTLAKECHDRALLAHKQYLSDGILTEGLLLGAIHLARIDRVFRDGPEHLRKEWFALAYPREMADLRRLYEIVPREKFQSQHQCFLNPTFDLASKLVKGADADVIIDDCLIDIKTTKYLRFKLADLHQIVGYYILYLLSGKSTRRPLGEIKRIGIYFSRHAFLHTLDIEKIVENSAMPQLVKGFIELAVPDPNERKTYLAGFEYPACQEWLRDLGGVIKSDRREAGKASLHLRIKKYAVEAVNELKEAGEWKRDEERINYRCDCDPHSERKGSPLTVEITFILRGETFETFSINFDLRRGREKSIARENIEEIKRKVRSYFEEHKI